VLPDQFLIPQVRRFIELFGVRHVGLVDVMSREIVRIFVSGAVSPGFGIQVRVAEMVRDFPVRSSLDLVFHLVEGDVGGVRFGCGGDIDHGLGQGDLAFGEPQPFHGLGGRGGHQEGPGVGVPDVFRRGDEQPSRDEPGVFACREHLGHPVEGRVRVRSAQGFDEGGDGVIVVVAGFVVTDGAGLDGGFRDRQVDPHPAAVSRGRGQHGQFDGVDHASGVPGAHGDQVLPGVVGHLDGLLRRERRQRPRQDLPKVVLLQGMELKKGGTGQEGGVDVERGVFRRQADQRDGAPLDVRKEGVLLGSVEMVDLVEDQPRPLVLDPSAFLGLLEDHPDVGDPHGDRVLLLHVGLGLERGQPGQGRLPRAGRAEEDRRSQTVRLDAPPQEGAGIHQMSLAGEIGPIAGSQTGRQRGRRSRL